MAPKQQGFAHGFLNTGEVRLHYVEQGKGPLLLLLHGFPDYWYGWRHQIPAFSTTHHVVAPDLRGYNDSDKPRARGAYRMQSLVEDVSGAIRDLGYDKAVLVGHDWGGAVAWAFAYAHPEMLDGLVILNAPHPAKFAAAIRTWTQIRRSWYMFFFQLPWLPEWAITRNDGELMVSVYRGTATQKKAVTDADLKAYRAAVQKPGAATGMLNYYRNLIAAAGRARSLGKLKVPTLVLWGMDDVALGPQLIEGLDKYVDDLTLVRIEDAGHFVHQERPDTANQQIRKFLDRLDGKPRQKKPKT
jgi:pimeloyl-ACP methyl ester carboxylesterase